MEKSSKPVSLLLLALFCSSMTHAQQQITTGLKDSIDNRKAVSKWGKSVHLKLVSTMPLTS